MGKYLKIGIIAEIIVVFLLLCYRFIDVDFGRCLNSEGDGKLYNGEPYYNYINYNGHVNANYDDIIMTISLNDFNNECVKRWDYVIFQNTPSSFDTGNLEVVG